MGSQLRSTYIATSTPKGGKAIPLKKNTEENVRKQMELPSMAQPLGKAVKLLRGRLRLNQTQLVNRVPGQITQSYLSRVEKGKCFPRHDSLSAIVEALDCTHRELWDLAETLAAANLDETNADDVLECISHESLGCSYEEVEAVYSALKDEVVVELVSFNKMLADGKKLDESQLAEIDSHLRQCADSLPEDTSTLREYIDGMINLLLTACKKHALSTP